MLLGKKIGMTQVYDEMGTLHPVTVLQVGPCPVLQVKTDETDGYQAIQIGFEDVRAHRSTQPAIGHAAAAGAAPQRFIREFREEEFIGEVEVGQKLTVDIFDEINFVDVIGTTKGKGTAGVMKRYGFGGQPATHGTERKHRSPGSIGGHGTNLGTGPKIKKGKRMAGRMGNVKCTSRKHKIIGRDKENNLLLVKGAVPGANGGFIMVRKSKTAKA